MDRKRIEQELSLHLDGRLPSGRREVLLDRVADHEEVADLLAAMERAREIAQSLPSQTVGANFTRDLWDRIRSGEGTPEAVFREPLPLWTKIRYVATGAAAAAAVILGASILSGRTTSPDPIPEGQEQVARVDSTVPSPEQASNPTDAADPLRAAPRQGGLLPVGASRGGLPEVLPVNALSLATAGRAECIDAIRDLQREIPSVEAQMVNAGFGAIANRLDPLVTRARGPVHVIRWLQNERMVKLNHEFDATLTLAEQILNRFERANHKQDEALFRVAAEDMRDLRIDRLDREIDVVCCHDQDEFISLLREHLLCNPGAFRVFRIETPGIDPFNLNVMSPGAGSPFFSEPGSFSIQIVGRRR